jgi:hypothetical protein
MKVVSFGLGVSSSWGNGHATHWRAGASAGFDDSSQLKNGFPNFPNEHD